MKAPHLYLSQGFIIQGIPISKEDLERETGTKTTFGKDAVFLENVFLLGSSGTRVEVQYFVLDGSSITGVGKNNIRISENVNHPALFKGAVNPA